MLRSGVLELGTADTVRVELDATPPFQTDGALPLVLGAYLSRVCLEAE